MLAIRSNFSFIVVVFVILTVKVSTTTKAYKCNPNNPRTSDECTCFPSNAPSALSFECKEPNGEAFFISYYHNQKDGNKLDVQCPCPTHLQPTSLYNYVSDAFIIDESSQIYDLKLNHCLLPPSGLASVVQKWSNLSAVHRLTLKICSGNSSNKTLPSWTFHNITELTELELEKNNFETLPRSIFKHLTKLVVLSLGENHLVSVQNLFNDLGTLKYLLLGSNSIRELEQNTFEDLNNLNQLNLQDNQLHTLPEFVFAALKNLSRLDLSNNYITNLSENIFASNLKLRELALKRNRLTALPNQLFYNNTQLTNLSLYGNRNLSKLPDSLFVRTTSLQDLDLHSCNLNSESLSEDIFTSLKELRKLNLASNRFEKLKQNWFANLPSLQELNLSQNRLRQLNAASFKGLFNLLALDLSANEIETVAIDTFTGLGKLQVLNLDRNKISLLKADSHSSSIFTGAENLQELYLRNNRLTEIDRSTMAPLLKLRKVYLTRNKLALNNSFSGELFSPFNSNLKLEEIDLSHNNIGEFFSDWGTSFVHLSNLDLSYNRLTALSFSDLPNYRQITVDVSNNHIAFLDFESAQFQDIENAGLISKVLRLQNNPLNCNCNAIHLARYMNRISPGVAHSWTIEPRTVTCNDPAELSGLKVTEVDPMRFLCPCETDTSPCRCNQRPADRVMLLDCQQQDLTSLKKPLPFSRDYKVRVNLSSNHIDPMLLPKTSFRQVTHLDLSRNQLNSSSLFDSVNWTLLFQETFPNLVSLDLRHNNLVSVPSSVIDVWNGSREFRIEMSDNPWSCDCNNLPLLNFIFSSFGRVDYNQLTCRDGTPLSNMNRDVCGSTNRAVIVAAIIVPLMAFFVAVTIFVVSYRNRRTLKAWLYSHKVCMSCVFQDDESDDEDRPYDAFVSYSHKDEEFISKHLVPNLERPENGLPSFRL